MNVIKRLDELLEKIQPANTIDRYERRRDKALNTFDVFI